MREWGAAGRGIPSVGLGQEGVPDVSERPEAIGRRPSPLSPKGDYLFFSLLWSRKAQFRDRFSSVFWVSVQIDCRRGNA